MPTSNALTNSSAAATAPAPHSATVALVDDDSLFVTALERNLSDADYEVVTFDRGQPALEFFRAGGSADLILLDWRMPEMDGIEVLHRLRESGNDVPVIFLTVLSDQIYEEAALAGGAIDFVEKSRSFSILLRRIQLILEGRKGAQAAGAEASADQPAEPAPAEPAPAGGGGNRLKRGHLDLDLKACRATWQGRRVDLTLTEFQIVRELAEHADEDLTYRALYDLVRGAGFVAGYGAVGYRSNVRQFIKRIRQKFRDVDPKFEHIENYPGFGYRWRGDGG
jgi:two-component system response regulator ChvI